MLKAIIDGVAQTYTSEEVPLQQFNLIRARIYSAAGSTATVVLEGAASLAGAPWFTLYTVTNPTATGDYVNVPMVGRLRARIPTWTAGTIHVSIEGKRL